MTTGPRAEAQPTVKEAAQGSLPINTEPQTTALPQEVLLDQYMLAGNQRLEQQDYPQALAYFQRALALRMALPLEFYYVYAVSLFHTQQYALAQQQLHSYLTRIERAQGFYNEALLLLTEVEQELQAEAASAEQTAPAATLRIEASEEGQSYLKRLRRLHQTEEVREALLLQINTLLLENSQTLYPTDIVEAERSQPGARRYESQVGVFYEAEEAQLVATNLVVDRIRGVEQSRRTQTQQLSLYGLPPYVDFQCQAGLCWLALPNQDSRFVYVNEASDALLELRRAFAYLIRDLQR